MSKVSKIVLTGSVIVGLLSLGVIAAPFITASNQVKPSPSNADLTSIPKSLDGFYSQKPLWSDCKGSNSSARCGNIQVPLDWNNPSKGSIKIAVAINPATNPDTAPYLLMNPGGPGASGRDWITENITSLGTARLRAHYNIVGFDPRGVGASTAIKCYDTAKSLDFFYNPSPYKMGSTQDLEFTKNSIADFGKACKKNTGPLLGHVDTSSAAKDMDIIRAVLGSKKLNYLGFSYGTLLGSTYAAFFPKNIGQFVLDGVVDPTLNPSDDSVNQLIGFQSAMRAYLADCIKSVSGCPFAGLTVDQAMDKVGMDFLSVLEKQPITTTEKGRKLTSVSGFTGMIAALYSKDSWQYLTQAFNEFFKKRSRDGRIFLLLADSYYEYDDSTAKFSNNGNEAFKAITCLDSRESSSMADMKVQNARVLKTSKVFGKYWQYGGLACWNWPYEIVPGPSDYSAKDSPTIMVVGTTNDPATPYVQAQNVAHNVLAHGWLLTFKGEGHAAYGMSNSCIANTVDDFLIENKLPAKEKTC